MLKNIKSNLMEIHYGEDYVSGFIGNDSIFTTLNQSSARKKVLEKMALRYNIHDALVDAATKFVEKGWDRLPTCTYQDFETLVAIVRSAKGI